jgi:protocatechuate 3,4-dioxygenase beta subunit
MGGAPPRSRLDRRQALTLLARGGALLAVGCGGTSAEPPACLLAPVLTAGPYWRDDPLRRSDLRSDSGPSSGAEPLPGVLLDLALQVSTTSENQCRPLRGAQVDIWQCDAQGVYSGVPELGTTGRDFLRGFQITDDAGWVQFLTVFPGWYPGRTVHIHAKVRTFDPFGGVVTEVSTQLFFDDALTDAVFESAAYAGRGPRDTRNARDPVLGGQPARLVSLTGDASSGLRGVMELGVTIGEIRPG